MKYVETYTLRAYDVDTGKLAFEWTNVADTERARPAKDSIITDVNYQDWLVIGVHYASTAAEWSIDVCKASRA